MCLLLQYLQCVCVYYCSTYYKAVREGWDPWGTRYSYREYWWRPVFPGSSRLGIEPCVFYYCRTQNSRVAGARPSQSASHRVLVHPAQVGVLELQLMCKFVCMMIPVPSIRRGVDTSVCVYVGNCACSCVCLCVDTCDVGHCEC